MIFISVDLPAPFSPTTAWMVCGSTGKRHVAQGLHGPKLWRCGASPAGGSVGVGFIGRRAHVQEAAALHLRGQAVFRGWMDSSWAAQARRCLAAQSREAPRFLATSTKRAWVGVSVGERSRRWAPSARRGSKPNRSRGLSQVERLRRSMGSGRRCRCAGTLTRCRSGPSTTAPCLHRRAWRRRSCHRAGARSRA